MPPAIIAGGVAAAGAIGGAVLSSNAQRRAASTAANAAQSTATQNNALQQQIYNQNYATLNPYVSRGNEAGSAINSLLGIAGTAPAGAQGTQQYGPAAPLGGGYSGPTLQQIYAMQNDGIPGNFQPALNAYMAGQGAGGPAAGGAPATAPSAGGVTTPAPTPQANYQNAFQNYLNSTGYQFQVDQGNRGINQGYAARGALQSGAALRALQTYGQNTATGFFRDYLGLLSNQQGVGLSGANAIAGVGTNYANSVSANNNNAGNAAANNALLAGNANANMWGNISGAVGGLANAFGSSYRPA